MDSKYKVVDYFNGWESNEMSLAQAEKYLSENKAPTSRGVEPATAEWKYDHRTNEWAWFNSGKRIS